MYEIFTQVSFSAAHHLVDYDGNCSQIHGHNWEVTVFVQAHKLSRAGMAVDLRKLRRQTYDTLQALDHTDLNEHPAFAVDNPTCENIAYYLYHELASVFNNNDHRLSCVQVTEGSNSGAKYWEE